MLMGTIFFHWMSEIISPYLFSLTILSSQSLLKVDENSQKFFLDRNVSSRLALMPE